MRELHTFRDEPSARRFVAVLRVRNMPAHAEPEDSSWIIWIENDDDRDKARELLTRYLQNPDAQEFAEAEASAQQLQKESERLRRQRQRSQIDIRDRWQGVWWKSWPATYLLIAASFVVALLCTDWQQASTVHGFIPQLCNDQDSALRNALFIQPPGHSVQVFGYIFPLEPPTLMETMQTGQIWRLVTPIFLHFDGLHILFNMMWMRSLGCAVEFVRGTRRFVLLVLIVAILSNLAQYFWAGPRFGGMSGVVFGLIGYVWIKGKIQPQYGLGLSPDQFVWSMLWMLLCMAGAFGNVANACHVSGFLLGVVLAARQTMWKSFLNKFRPGNNEA